MVFATHSHARTMVNVGYFNATQQVAMTVFGVLAGGVMRVTRRYKVGPYCPGYLKRNSQSPQWLCFVGLLIHLLYVHILVHDSATS